jgi:hypothetical protein
MPGRRHHHRHHPTSSALTQAEIEATVGRLVEALRDFLILLVRLSREHLRPGGPQ